ncbi:sulfatase family protein [Membranihabitans maritimus]|uniref:sulfatase family protein n=1 Tax=Membranihabitans maritimus TaxID=2904244 RepID=UPI001F3B5D1F|nr:sulfatase [Membranihabitans maritimus]
MGNDKILMLFVLFSIVFLTPGCDQSTDSAVEVKSEKPNVVLIFIDDGAFDDYSPFGNPRYPTPHVEQLASEGRSFYSFYVPQAVCSASRAALLTGCYPGRTGVFGAHGPNQGGLSTAFATLGEVMKTNGYTTGSFGKWHIGDQEGRRPQDRGFDESCGLMYSNDMWKHHPENPDYWGQFPIRYWENGEITIDTLEKGDQKMLTTWYTESAVDFINRNKEEPFFLYLAHSMPHVPLFVSDKFDGKSGTGLYGDVMMEIDWSVGQVNQALKDNGLEDNTVVIFIGSDNGPWLSYGDHAGITRFREGKGTTFDGGVRNPCIIKYPGIVEGNTKSHKAFASIDILPTVCSLTDTELPDNEVDGKNVWDIVLDKPEAKNPHKYYPFSNGSNFEGIITGDGKWKLHLKHKYRTLEMAATGGMAGKYVHPEIDTSLFDMVHDPYEKGNVIEEYPDVARSLIQLAEGHENRFYSETD